MMFSCTRIGLKAVNRRLLSTSSPVNAKVAVLGASGGIGQPLGLLLKLNPRVSQLSLFDVQHTPGVASDLSHCDSPARVQGFTGEAELAKSLEGCELVVIPAGVPRKPGMTRDDLFNTNASIVRDLVTKCADVCPKALIAIITNPVNSTVPIAFEVYKQKGIDGTRKIFGVTTLDVVRANTFISEKTGIPVSKINVPVIGGHAGKTIIPLLSQSTPNETYSKFSADDYNKMVTRIQNAGTEVVEAKAGAGSATLSMAHAAAKFSDAALRALNGDSNVVMCAYVKSDVTAASFFSTPLTLGKDGWTKNHGLGTLNEAEQKLVDDAVPELQNNIKKGEEFASK